MFVSERLPGDGEDSNDEDDDNDNDDDDDDDDGMDGIEDDYVGDSGVLYMYII